MNEYRIETIRAFRRVEGFRILVETDGDSYDVNSAVADMYLERGRRARVLVSGRQIVGIGHVDPVMDPVTSDIIRMHGGDIPAIETWMTRRLVWAERDSLKPECPEKGVQMDEDGHVHAALIWEGYSYSHGTISIQDRMPETTVEASIGRLLREVVSIPRMDTLDLAILDAQVTPLGTDFTVARC